MTVRATQEFRRALAEPETPEVRATQVFRRLLGEPGTTLRATQVFRRLLINPTSSVRATQLFRRLLVAGFPCVAETCQIWKITRRDGTVFRYTSHSQNLELWGYTWQACLSLQQSATQSSSELGSAGDFTLEGVISDDSVSEEDLYGGLFDDAFVECWRVDWGNTGTMPLRLFAGWVGDTTFSQEDGLKMSALGPSHRLEQNSITQVIAPACRWVFGSTECGFDREALKLTGTVLAAAERGAFSCTLSGGDGGWYWNNGLVRFLTGRNAGQSLEVKTVAFGDPASESGTGTATGTATASGTATGSDATQIVLWALAPLLMAPGDTFELLPGCDKTKDSDTGCQLYANKINFGGFPDVPGEDALVDSPDAKY